MNARLGLVLLLALTGLGFGCASSADQPRYIFQVDTGDLARSMRGVGTVSMHPRARVVRPLPGRSEADLRSATDAAVIRVFQERGYSLAPMGQGDRVIAYAIGVSGELADAELAQMFGVSAGLDGEGLRGGLALVIANPRTGQVEWRASGSAPVDPTQTDRWERDRGIKKAMGDLLADLPQRRGSGR